MKINLIIISCILSSITAASEPEYNLAMINSALHKFGIAQHPLMTLQGTTARMVVFTTYDDYKVSDKKLGATIWATVDPELKNLCMKFLKENHNNVTHEQLVLWLVQILGLPSQNAMKRQFVEFDVPVIQAYYGSSVTLTGIFRLCTDPRITARNDGSDICPKAMRTDDPAISTDFKTWFINNSIAAYNSENGMPWSEYGYTYNWDPHAESVYGVSEFVITKNIPVTVLSNPINAQTPYISPEQFCS